VRPTGFHWPEDVVTSRDSNGNLEIQAKVIVAKSEYIILRRNSPPKRTSRSMDTADARAVSERVGRTSTPRRSSPWAVAQATAPWSLAVSPLDRRDAEDLRRDPQVALARSVPLALIRPVAAGAEKDEKALQSARTHGTSWGVEEVAPGAARDAGAATTVAVLDSGIDPTHPAFKGVNLLTENFSESLNASDVLGHGTHCAGTIFGRDVDGVRIGIARGVRNALIGKILNDKGEGDTAIFARALQWAVDHGARVISMSLGLNFHDLFDALEGEGHPRAQAFSLALSQYRDTVRLFDAIVQSLNASGVVLRAGAIVVGAAGNESDRCNAQPCMVDVGLPAAALGVISVGALERGEKGFEIAGFSNANPQLWAPGVGIVSAKVGGGLAVSQGTSMAAPHVSGAAVLWSERLYRRNPRTTPDELKGNLIAAARTTGFSRAVAQEERGAGLVQAPPD
jgi:subtilisin family serine protease